MIGDYGRCSTTRRAGTASAFVLLFSASSVAAPALASAQDADLRLGTRPLVGPRRDEVEDAQAYDRAPPDAEEEPLIGGDEEPPYVAPPASIPEPPSASQTPATPATPGLAPRSMQPATTTRTRAEHLYAQLTMGYGTSIMAGAKVVPSLGVALGVSFRPRPPWRTPRLSDAASRLIVANSLLFGTWLDAYPRGGPFHIRAGLGGSVVYMGAERTLEDGTVVIGDVTPRIGPMLNLGVGVQWRPIGTFGRFRLGFLLDASASTIVYDGRRQGVFDLTLFTTVTWF